MESSTSTDEFIPINSVKDFGRLLRESRKARKMTIKDAAALAGFSIQFLHDLETGKPTIQMGRALDYALKVGLKFHASGPPLAGSLPTQPGLQKSKRNLVR